MEQGQDPVDYSVLLDERRARLAETGEGISDETIDDIVLRGITSGIDYISNTSYRDENSGLKDMQPTMHRMCINPPSRKRKPMVAGRGAAMSANHTYSETLNILCLNSHKRGHRKSVCTQPKRGSSAPTAAGSVSP